MNVRKIRSIWQLDASEAELPSRSEARERVTVLLRQPVQIGDLPCAAGTIEASAETGQVVQAILARRVRLRLGLLRSVECLEGTRVERTARLDAFTPAHDFKCHGRWYAGRAEFVREGPIRYAGVLARPARCHGVDIPAGARLGEQPDWGAGRSLHFEVVLSEPSVVLSHELPAGSHLLIGPAPEAIVVTPPCEVRIGALDIRANEAFLLARSGEATQARR